MLVTPRVLRVKGILRYLPSILCDSTLELFYQNVFLLFPFGKGEYCTKMDFYRYN